MSMSKMSDPTPTSKDLKKLPTSLKITRAHAAWHATQPLQLLSTNVLLKVETTVVQCKTYSTSQLRRCRKSTTRRLQSPRNTTQGLHSASTIRTWQRCLGHRCVGTERHRALGCGRSWIGRRRRGVEHGCVGGWGVHTRAPRHLLCEASVEEWLRTGMGNQPGCSESRSTGARGKFGTRQEAPSRSSTRRVTCKTTIPPFLTAPQTTQLSFPQTRRCEVLHASGSRKTMRLTSYLGVRASCKLICQ